MPPKDTNALKATLAPNGDSSSKSEDEDKLLREESRQAIEKLESDIEKLKEEIKEIEEENSAAENASGVNENPFTEEQMELLLLAYRHENDAEKFEGVLLGMIDMIDTVMKVHEDMTGCFGFVRALLEKFANAKGGKGVEKAINILKARVAKEREDPKENYEEACKRLTGTN